MDLWLQKIRLLWESFFPLKNIFRIQCTFLGENCGASSIGPRHGAAALASGFKSSVVAVVIQLRGEKIASMRVALFYPVCHWVAAAKP